MSHIHFVKICGITRAEDAKLVMKLGGDAIGFIFYPESKRFIPYEKAAEIVQALHDDDNNFDLSADPNGELENNILITGVFVNAEPDEIKRAVETASLDVIQLHGNENPAYIQNLRASFPHLIYIKALRLGTSEAALNYPVDFILLDHDGTEWGGSGQTIDWEKARAFIEHSELPVILAGGLNPGNVMDAYEATKPNGVDISSGVESSPGVKSPEKLKALFNLVRPK